MKGRDWKGREREGGRDRKGNEEEEDQQMCKIVCGAMRQEAGGALFRTGWLKRSSSISSSISSSARSRRKRREIIGWRAPRKEGGLTKD